MTYNNFESCVITENEKHMDLSDSFLKFNKLVLFLKNYLFVQFSKKDFEYLQKIQLISYLKPQNYTKIQQNQSATSPQDNGRDDIE